MCTIGEIGEKSMGKTKKKSTKTVINMAVLNELINEEMLFRNTGAYVVRKT